jgi:hypothetical protein
MYNTNKSEVARIRERIACEYEAANRVFTGFTPTARHEFITRRQENIATCFAELRQYMSPEEAVMVVVQAEALVQNSSFSSNNNML